MSVGDVGPYLNEQGDIWVPRTVPYLEARRIAKDGLSAWDDRLVYVGKANAGMLGFVRDCRCDETCELTQRCASCDHDHGDYDGQCWADDCTCQRHLRPPASPCDAPAWHFRSVEPR